MSAASIWSAIDELKRKAAAEHVATEAALEQLPGAGKLTIDDYGVWKVRCRRGREASELVTAKGGGSAPRAGPCVPRAAEGGEQVSLMRGTSNANMRGNSTDRARRREYLLRTFESDKGPGTVRCYRCGAVLEESTLTVDRIVPGCLGGKYRRNNVRPACGRCNQETGGALRGVKP